MASAPYTPAPPAGPRPPAPRSLFGPVVLITLGIMLLLMTTGRIPKLELFNWFARYWPLLLILWGVAKIIDHQQARRHGYRTSGMGAGGVFLLILLTFIGLGATGFHSVAGNINEDWVRDHVQFDDDDDFAGIFGQKFQYSQQLTETLPANGSLKVVCERGNIRVRPGTDNQVHVTISKIVFANNQAEADKRRDDFLPTIKLEGTVVNVDASRLKGGRADIDITLPKKADLDLMTLRGDIDVADREGKIKAHTSRGGLTFENITGDVESHLRRGDFTAKTIKGDVAVEGRVDDSRISDVTGQVRLEGDYMGDVSLSKIAKGVRFKSSRTDMEFVKLDGDFEMSGGDLRVRDLYGPFRIDTRAKDIHLDDISGDVRIEDEHGDVEVHPKQVGNMEVSNRSGAIRVVIPGNANFEVNARADRGEVDTDFSLNKSESGRTQTLQGVVNKGGPKLQLNNDHGTIAVFRTEGQRAKDELGDPSDFARSMDRKAEEQARKAEERARKIERDSEQRAREAEQRAREAQRHE